MRIAITADLHFRDNTDKDSARLHHIVNAFRWIERAAYNKKAKALIIAGDVFHHRKSIPIGVLVAAYDALSECRMPLYIVVGNHDIDIKGATVSAQIFKKIATIIDAPEVHNIDGVPIGFVPWDNNITNLRKAIKRMHVKYLIGHFGIAGAVVGSSEYEMNEGLSANIFDTYKWVVLGHYHKNQKIRNVRYVGSPLQHNFGEAGERKGFYITAENDELRFITNNDSPHFITVETKDDLQYIGSNDLVRANEELAHKIPEGQLVKIIPKPPTTKESRLKFKSLQRTEILRQYIEYFPLDEVEPKILLESGIQYLED